MVSPPASDTRGCGGAQRAPRARRGARPAVARLTAQHARTRSQARAPCARAASSARLARGCIAREQMSAHPRERRIARLWSLRELARGAGFEVSEHTRRQRAAHTAAVERRRARRRNAGIRARAAPIRSASRRSPGTSLTTSSSMRCARARCASRPPGERSRCLRTVLSSSMSAPAESSACVASASSASDRSGAGQAEQTRGAAREQHQQHVRGLRSCDQRERLARRPLAARVGHGVRGLAQRNPREASGVTVLGDGQARGDAIAGHRFDARRPSARRLPDREHHEARAVGHGLSREAQARSRRARAHASRRPPASTAASAARKQRSSRTREPGAPGWHGCARARSAGAAGFAAGAALRGVRWQRLERDLDAAVLLATLGCVVRGDRLVFAVRNGDQPLGVDLVLREKAHDAARARAGQLPVRRKARRESTANRHGVGVPADLDALRRSFRRCATLPSTRAAGGVELRRARREEHVLREVQLRGPRGAAGSGSGPSRPRTRGPSPARRRCRAAARPRPARRELAPRAPGGSR